MFDKGFTKIIAIKVYHKSPTCHQKLPIEVLLMLIRNRKKKKNIKVQCLISNMLGVKI